MWVGRGRTTHSPDVPCRLEPDQTGRTGVPSEHLMDARSPASHDPPLTEEFKSDTHFVGEPTHPKLPMGRDDTLGVRLPCTPTGWGSLQTLRYLMDLPLLKHVALDRRALHDHRLLLHRFQSLKPEWFLRRSWVLCPFDGQFTCRGLRDSLFHPDRRGPRMSPPVLRTQ